LFFPPPHQILSTEYVSTIYFHTPLYIRYYCTIPYSDYWPLLS
jgi:hypothetical protein